MASRTIGSALVLLLAGFLGRTLAADTTPPPGLRENTPQVHALTGARIVTAPGQVLEKGTLVIRDGVIVDVGPDVTPPADARVWDLAGKTIYAGLIDAYGEIDVPAPAAGSRAGYWNDGIVPQVRADDGYAPDGGLNQTLRQQGVTARLVAPAAGSIRGTSTLVSTADDEGSQAVLRGQVAMHMRLQPPPGGSRSGYPTSPMGAVALVRQALFDAAWHRQAWQVFNTQPGLPRPQASDALAALEAVTASPPLVVMIDAPDELFALRADAIGKEFSLSVLIRGSGLEYRRLEAIKATGRAVIVPLQFPDPPAVNTPEAARGTPLETLLHWDLAPENPARLDAAGVRIALTSHGLGDRNRFLEMVRLAVSRGLSPECALRALTVTPAELFGVADRLGTLAAGKAAHLVVTDGDLFAKETKLLEVWIEGRRHELIGQPGYDLRGDWDLAIRMPDGSEQQAVVHLEGEPASPGGKIKLGDKESGLTSTSLDDTGFRCAFKGELLGWAGVVRLSAAVSLDQAAGDTWLGTIAWADGGSSALTGKRAVPMAAAEAAAAAPAATPQRTALFPVNFPLGPFGVAGPPVQPPAVVFKNATVWTCGPHGILERASVLVENGKITAIGPDLVAPNGAVEIDATSQHLSPGIIDCHAHIATDGGVNESGQTITAEVRIGDFINPDDVNIYRQLAGGVTGVNILHGSSNTIGGQNQVVKLRWGALPDEMRLAGAPPGIKFALGENVKQSNWGDDNTTRYPQTRMGVEQLVLDAFQAAQHYQRTWDRWRASPQGLPPRVDLELEALAEVLAGKRLIHCHSYRQDEILAFLRTCHAFGVRVGTLQHVLEGYKLADVLAQQGVGGSTFSDWWAYKFEVYDAIPYNAALMHNAGVVVSLNSDFPELGRRLNTEAAKAVKYGGVPPIEALKFITLNPARQLGIDTLTGSIEVGKDADLVLWNGSPLSSYSRCEQTWVDGRRYFDRQEDAARRAEAERMRAALVQRILNPDAMP